MAVERVVVQVDLGVNGLQRALGVDDQRVDLGERAIVVHERLIEAAGDGAERPQQPAGQVERKGRLAHLEVLQTQQRIGADLDDLLWCRRGDLFDVYAALATGHQGHAPGGAVQHQAEIDFPRDVGRLRHQHLLDPVPLDVHAQDRSGLLAGLRGCIGQLDAPGLAPAHRLAPAP